MAVVAFSACSEPSLSVPGGQHPRLGLESLETEVPSHALPSVNQQAAAASSCLGATSKEGVKSWVTEGAEAMTQMGLVTAVNKVLPWSSTVPVVMFRTAVLTSYFLHELLSSSLLSC
jgi:hypothetical protein